MRIVIDMQGAQTESRFRGIGRYTLSLARAVARNRGEHEVFLALSGLFPDTIMPIRNAFRGLLPQENIRVWQAPGPVKEEEPGNETRRQIAELVREAFLASLQADLIHVSSLFEGYVDDAVTSIGRFDLRTAISVTIHDLIPLLNPDQYLGPNPPYERYYRRKLEYLKQARCCLAVSEFSRQEALQHLELNPATVSNISTAIDDHFKPISVSAKTKAEIFRRFSLSCAFVLYTGGCDQRKNLPRLIHAYSRLSEDLRKTHHLLFAGRMPDGDVENLRQIVYKAGLNEEELLFTGYISDEELVQLYNLCALYVFPSWHEGYDLPVLEAMACGAPVIAANTSSLPELVDLDEALFDPMDESAIAAKMTQALTDKDFRTNLKEHGLQRAAMFSWDKSAQRAIAAWEALPPKNVHSNNTIQLEYKPKLAFVSPMPPEQTGIAVYSAELLPALAEYYDIDVVVDQDVVDDPWVNQHCRIRDIKWLRENIDKIERVVYHIGNSHFHAHMLSLIQEIPGTIVMHDFYVSGLIGWLELCSGITHAWTRALYTSHGYAAVQLRYHDIEACKFNYPINLDLVQQANGVIVHSQYSKQLAQNWFGNNITEGWCVIPLLRAPLTSSIDKTEAKLVLGFSPDDFLICSFGFLGETKLNHCLLDSWLESTLSKENRSHLVFVGENHGGDYGQALLRKIRSSRNGNKIRITGYVLSDLFHQYLAATDIAIQLRANSRGETSASALDCMNHGLPLIVNANGSMAELDREAVWMLPDNFSDSELLEALETLYCDHETRRALGQRAQFCIQEQHAPAKSAKLYAEAIERFHLCSQTSTASLLRAIATTNGAGLSDDNLVSLSTSIAASFPVTKSAKRLYLDISATHQYDLKTGIERVARALMLSMIESPPSGYRIEPVYLDRSGTYWVYRHACRYTLGMLKLPEDALNDDVVEPENGDILLGLDWSGDALIQAQKSGLHAEFRNKGVEIYYLVFDLLPVKMPDVFPPEANKSFEQWLRAISSFDGAICISKTVAADLAQWQQEAGVLQVNPRLFRCAWSHLGADLKGSSPSLGLPDNASDVLGQLKEHPSFLMVGTIEPRKGYLQTVEAFEQLWLQGMNINLVIVGNEGWKPLNASMRRDIPETIQKLRSHPLLGHKLFWLEGISDEYLEKVYSASTCLIAASYGEGFGLPLIEAAQHKLPILARDIPVFREVAGEHASYFEAEFPEQLATAIRRWLKLFEKNKHPRSDQMPWLTWKQSAQNLLDIVLKKDPAGRSAHS